MAGRRIWAGLHLLDRQIVDCNDRLCGNVDDIELTASDDGTGLFVTAIYSGPGALSYRMGRHRLGRALERMHGTHPVAFEHVTEVGSAVTVNVPRNELPDYGTEKWVRDHLISHIPGATHAAE